MTKNDAINSYERATELPEHLPLFFKPREVAAILGVTDKAVRDHLQDGSVPGTKLGSSWRIPRSYVLSLMAVGE